jgi:hypothetical protein
VRRWAGAAALVVCVGLAAAVLLLFPPQQYGFYPACPVYRYLHVLCPGCGATRALAALLHGQVSEALRLNWLIMALLPVCGAYGAMAYRRWLRGEKFVWPRVPVAAIYGALVVTGVFGIVRNL